MISLLDIIRLICFASLVLLAQITVFSQEYTYDPNGNLNRDINKQIASIHYNHLYLVDTIIYEDGRRIVYTYTASGNKLIQQVIEASGALRQKRDYDSRFIYERDTLREIQHGEGRLVPVAPGDAGTPLEYQYHVKDHLGDVRATLTTAPQTDAVTASFERASAPFLRYESARRVNAVLFDHTQKASAGETHYAQCLNGSVNGRYGLAKSIAVMPGDTVKLEVYAKYVDLKAANLTTALTALLGQIAAGAASGIVADGPAYAAGGAPFPFAGLNNTSSSIGNGPKAYLNYLFFDDKFVFQSGGYVRVSTAAEEKGLNVPHERLATTVVIRQPGFVYAYLSNEEPSFEIYFDDFSVTHIQGPVIRQTDYDPFGLVFNEFSRENAVPNNFLYNGKELQREFDLDLYDYGARMYDAVLGRWHAIDPLAEKYAGWSPYNYVMNNPLTLVDPEGRDIKNIKNDPDVKADAIKKAAMAIPEGKRVFNEVKGNHKIKVYYTITKDEIGETVVLTDLKPDKSGRYVVTGNIAQFKPFNGLDVTTDIQRGKTVYLVAAGTFTGQPYLDAEILLHELEAHINGPQRAGLTYRGATEDHKEYGSGGSMLFKSEKRDGKVRLMFNNVGDAPENSSFVKISRQLLKLFEEDLNNKMNKRNKH